MKLNHWVLVFAAISQVSSAFAANSSITPGSPNFLNISIYFDYDEVNLNDWEPVFTAASELLFNATEKQMQLGEVKAFNRCPAVKNSADVIVSDREGGGIVVPMRKYLGSRKMACICISVKLISPLVVITLARLGLCMR